MAAAIYFAMSSASFAQAEPAAGAEKAKTLDTITVTSQKREENLQKVPVSIQVLGEQKLKEQHVASFQDYAALLPSVSFQAQGGGVFPGPGFLQVYMRGVASGGDGNHSGSQPSVGVYLDEQPITTIQGALDVNIYDVSRIEALAGPQGTLYGASSQAGTLRIITNKPDPSGFAAGYSIEGSKIEGGGVGHVLQGFGNFPVSDNAAIRLVAWTRHDAGYVDNVRGTRTFPTSGITIDNANRAENDYNTSDTDGLRAALKVDLNDRWSITPTVMTQRQKSYGSAGYEPARGDLQLTHFYPESSKDKWTQAALTIQGKIGNFDLTYTYSHLKRDVDSESDYNDYAFWYDTLNGSGAFFYDDSFTLINPSQYIQAVDGYKKQTHELRIASPADNRWRFVAGVFWQSQTHDILQRYRVDNLASIISVPGWEDTIWLTAQQRRDKDTAFFGEVSFDITDKLTATGGMRFFKADNSLKGFFGYGAGFSGSTGESQCFSAEKFHGAPCTNLDKSVDESDHLGRFNLTYQIDDKRMIYFTWSEGYRPGGINRRGTLPPYQSDFLTNYEFGWKTTLLDDRLSFNGAVFQENWKDFQFSFLGTNGLTEIRNAAQARIRGVEAELNWQATYNLVISGGVALYDPKLTENYCNAVDVNGDAITNCAAPEARAGTRLPLTARTKGNLTARYTFDVGSYEAFWQGTVVHVGDRTVDLRDAQQAMYGKLDAYSTFDLSAGFKKNNWSWDFYLKNAFDERGELARFSQCAALTCGFEPYTTVVQPRTFGVRFSQEF
ncbi:TonB-dependent receptor [Arenimonas oryziterrae]|uniref:TonB-denpendent receptor n=1 Tax=Arenimonas oryziterrae DSM 21050 = YC6267 TaxID=1121015 RepID=A0A091BKL9_9GAMM|nr:TonB-dependent receptor [Arenimonas oryziterrae]KFN44855.1 hypothetical protein N789_02230 [Arenimonas oryziterrae DSM 21050 = YC6267]